MQLSLTISPANEPICLPLASSEVIQGMLYHALSDDPAYANHLHEQGSTDSGRSYKLFCFSELFSKDRYEVDPLAHTITYQSDISLEIRSTQPYFITLLFSYFTKNPNITLGGNAVTVRSPSLGDTHIFSDSIRVRTLSPITVYRTDDDGHTTYFSPENADDRRFFEAVEANARRKWRSMYGTDNGFSLTVSPTTGTRYTRRMTRFKSTFITAWHGTFELSGTPQTLDFLYQTGLGSKNSQGFGLFGVV